MVLWTHMNAPHTTRRRPAHSIDWAREAKLALILSVLAAVAATTLAGHVSDRVLVTATIIVASIVSWVRVQPLEPARVPMRRS